jgi:hypothetical protein
MITLNNYLYLLLIIALAWRVPLCDSSGRKLTIILLLLILEQLFTSKIRLKLLNWLFLNSNTRVFLRGLEREFDVSSNTVRLELAKLTVLHLIKENTMVKEYSINK